MFTIRDSKAINQLFVGLALITTACLFQNFDFSRELNIKVLPLNENARIDHAQELLGINYIGSKAQRVEQQADLGLAIFSDVYRNLPLSHKSFAVGLSRAIVEESERYKLDPVFVMAVIKTESNFNPLARGRHGEIGLMQMKPNTAAWISRRIGKRWLGSKSLENPIINVRISVAYFAYLRKRYNNEAQKYITAYNMGVTKLNRSYIQGKRPQEYSTKILTNYHITYDFIASAGTGFIAFN